MRVTSHEMDGGLSQTTAAKNCAKPGLTFTFILQPGSCFLKLFHTGYDDIFDQFSLLRAGVLVTPVDNYNRTPRKATLTVR